MGVESNVQWHCMADGLSTCEFDEEGCMTLEPVRRSGRGARWSEEVADRRLLIVRPPEGMLVRETTWEYRDNYESV